MSVEILEAPVEQKEDSAAPPIGHLYWCRGCPEPPVGTRALCGHVRNRSGSHPAPAKCVVCADLYQPWSTICPRCGRLG